jgi:hypothetical protein
VIIQHPNKTHEASCASAESSRQAAVAAAIAAGDIAYYRSVIASAKANGQPYGNFLEALTWLGASA